MKAVLQSISLQIIVKSALLSLRTKLELEMDSLRNNIECLQGRIIELESKFKEATLVKKMVQVTINQSM